MGGNAIQQHGFPEKRLHGDEFHRLSNEVCQKLRAVFPGLAVSEVQSIYSKVDHGDLDVLINRQLVDGDPEKIAEALGSSLCLRDWPETGFLRPVTNYEVNGFQVDVIACPPEEYEFTCRYFAWNDLGNLIGLVAQRMGLKFGHAGLRYHAYDPENSAALIDKVLVTDDFDEALRFMGFNPETHAAGFHDLDEMFAYVMSSRYFDASDYPLEGRSHRARTRDKKRKTYKAFLEVCQNAPAGESISQRQALAQAKMVFPHFAIRLSQAYQDYALEQRAKQRMDGCKIMALTGLHGPELGNFMDQLRAIYSSPSLILNMSDSAWEKVVMSLYRKESHRVQ